MGAPLLEHWHEFYLLLGTAAAALIALLFVAASVGVGFLSAEGASATRIYMSPVIFHFVSVLFICAIALVPTATTDALGALVGLDAVIGFVVCGSILLRVFRDATGASQMVDMSDVAFYGIGPLLAYLIALAGAVSFFYASTCAPDLIAAATILLLIVNIRNAWDLTLVMVRHQTQRAREAKRKR